MHVKEVAVKSALIRSKIPGVELVINPYIGCGHRCRDCHAAFMSKWSRQHAQSPWGTFVEPKIDIEEVLRAEPVSSFPHTSGGNPDRLAGSLRE